MRPGLGPLLDLPGVAAALGQARDAVDLALQGAARRPAGALAAEVALHSAVASAALEGHSYPAAQVRAGTVTDPVVQGALRVSAAAEALAERWFLAPRQVLARLHLLAARGCPGLPEAMLGRPKDRPEVGPRLDALCEIVLAPAREVPVLLRAAVVHGELLALGAFAGPNGVVARAAARLTMIAGGLDPGCLLAPEIGHLDREPEYIGAANAFATGTGDGVRAWIKHCASAVVEAAAQLPALADALGHPG